MALPPQSFIFMLLIYDKMCKTFYYIYFTKIIKSYVVVLGNSLSYNESFKIRFCE